MAVLTRKNNSATHPGDILLKNKQPRRSRQQIEVDEARAETVREEAAAKHHAVLGRIAQLEDSMAEEDEALRMHSIRPDLFHPRYVTESHQPSNSGVDKRCREPEELEGIAEQDLPDHSLRLSSPQSTDIADDSGNGSGSDYSIPGKESGDATEVASDKDMSASEEMSASEDSESTRRARARKPQRKRVAVNIYYL